MFSGKSWLASHSAITFISWVSPSRFDKKKWFIYYLIIIFLKGSVLRLSNKLNRCHSCFHFLCDYDIKRKVICIKFYTINLINVIHRFVKFIILFVFISYICKLLYPIMKINLYIIRYNLFLIQHSLSSSPWD